MALLLTYVATDPVVRLSEPFLCPLVADPTRAKQVLHNRLIYSIRL